MSNYHKLLFKAHEYLKVLILHINRFFISIRHRRMRKNTQLMTIHEKINLWLVKYQLFGCIEHHGACVNRRHYACIIRSDAHWYYCNDCNIQKCLVPAKDGHLIRGGAMIFPS